MRMMRVSNVFIKNVLQDPQVRNKMSKAILHVQHYDITIECIKCFWFMYVVVTKRVRGRNKGIENGTCNAWHLGKTYVLQQIDRHVHILFPHVVWESCYCIWAPVWSGSTKYWPSIKVVYQWSHARTWGTYRKCSCMILGWVFKLDVTYNHERKGIVSL